MRNKHTGAHTRFHTWGGTLQTVRSCCYPFSRTQPWSGSREAFKDESAFIAQGAPALLLPKRRNLTCSSWEMQSNSHTRRLPSAGSLLSFSVGKQQLASDSWWTHHQPEEAGMGMEKLNNPGHFTCSLHNWYTMGLLDRQMHNGVSTLLHEQNPLCGCGVRW